MCGGGVWGSEHGIALDRSAPLQTPSPVHVPIDCHRGGSLWDLVPKESVGPPQHYVCHAWGANLVDVVDQLVNRLLSHGK